MRKQIFRTAFYIILILPLGCKEKAQNISSSEIAYNAREGVEEIGKEIHSLLVEYNNKGKLNGNVLVVKKGETVHNGSYGYSDSTKQTLLTTAYKFGIGSIFKEFPAVSIMKLIEEGEVDLDDKLDKYIPELPNWAMKVSVKDLIQYTSGLPVIDWNKYFSENMAINDVNIMEDLLTIESLEFEPGSDYLYTNNSPFLLIQIVERVRKQSFGEYLQEELLIPLGMSNTEIKKEYPFQDRKFMAFPINSDFKEDKYKLKSSTLLLTSSVTDLYTWFIKLNGNEIIDRESVEFLAQTAELEIEDMQSPLGNCEFESEEILEHVHHGSMGNYECLVQRNNKEDLTIVILTNQKHQNVFEISEAIISLVNRESK